MQKGNGILRIIYLFIFRLGYGHLTSFPTILHFFLWRPVLLVEETRVPEESNWLATSGWQTSSHKLWIASLNRNGQ